MCPLCGQFLLPELIPKRWHQSKIELLKSALVEKDSGVESEKLVVFKACSMAEVAAAMAAELLLDCVDPCTAAPRRRQSRSSRSADFITL